MGVGRNSSELIKAPADILFELLRIPLNPPKLQGKRCHHSYTAVGAVRTKHRQDGTGNWVQMRFKYDRDPIGILQICDDKGACGMMQLKRHEENLGDAYGKMCRVWNAYVNKDIEREGIKPKIKDCLMWWPV